MYLFSQRVAFIWVGLGRVIGLPSLIFTLTRNTSSDGKNRKKGKMGKTQNFEATIYRSLA